MANQEREILENFAQSDVWRVFRIMAEFVEGFETLARVGPAVSVFGSARLGPDNKYYAEARRLGSLLAGGGFAVITGGGPGIMEAANRGAKEEGGQSIGLNIVLPHEQHPNPHVTTQMDFHYFFARKMMFVKYASAFVVFRRLRDDGRVLRVANPHPDRQGQPLSGVPGGQRILAGARGLAAGADAGHRLHRRAGPRDIPDLRRR